VFEEFNGLPLHPLAVHAAVVFVPLLVLASLAYALVPRWRTRVGWLAALLAVIAPISAVVARMSGESFAERRELPVEGDLANHSTYGTYTMYASLALGLLTLALYLVRRSGGGSQAKTWVAGALTGLVVIAAGVSVVYACLAGDLGSRIVWEGIWPG
jgi:uncharacterized membrane protein